MRQRQQLERSLTELRRIERDFEDNLTLIELGEAEDDEAIVVEGEGALKRLDEEVQRIFDWLASLIHLNRAYYHFH